MAKQKYIWKCLVCEQVVEDALPHTNNPDRRGIWPNIAGATIRLDCGYGSKFDQLGTNHQIQGCVCDECLEKKKHVLRMVDVDVNTRWTPLKPSDDIPFGDPNIQYEYW